MYVQIYKRTHKTEATTKPPQLPYTQCALGAHESAPFHAMGWWWWNEGKIYNREWFAWKTFFDFPSRSHRNIFYPCFSFYSPPLARTYGWLWIWLHVPVDVFFCFSVVRLVFKHELCSAFALGNERHTEHIICVRSHVYCEMSEQSKREIVLTCWELAWLAAEHFFSFFFRVGKLVCGLAGTIRRGHLWKLHTATCIALCAHKREEKKNANELKVNLIQWS